MAPCKHSGELQNTYCTKMEVSLCQIYTPFVLIYKKYSSYLFIYLSSIILRTKLGSIRAVSGLSLSPDTRNWASSRILSPMFYPASQVRTGESDTASSIQFEKENGRHTERNTPRQWRQDTRAEIPTNTKNIWHP